MLSDDVLPQPYRFINKLVNRCIDDAFEGIRKRQLAQQSHRQFTPPRTIHVHPADEIPVLVTASDQPIAGGPLRPTEPTSTYSGSSSIIFGFKQGNIVVHSAGTGDVLGLMTIKAGVPITAVTAASKHCVFAAATENTVTLFYALNEDASARALEAIQGADAAAALAAAAPVEGEENAAPIPVVPPSEMAPPTHTLALWTTVDPSICPQLTTSAVQDIVLSDDASHLAIVLGSGDEVICLRLASPDSVLRGDPLKSDENTAVTVAMVVKPPSAAVVDTQRLNIHLLPVCEFIVRDQVVTAHSIAAFGGHSHPHIVAPLASHLCVAWCGTNAFSTYSLKEASPMTGPQPPLNFSAAAEKALAPEAVSPAAQTGGGKSSKGKATEAAAAAPTAPVPQNTSAQGQVAAVATPTPGVPFTPVDVPFAGERHRFLSHFICTATLCRSTPLSDLFALGCFDGTIYVWSALKLSLIHTFEDAKHRASQKSVNPLLVTNIAFHKGTHLVAGLALPQGNIMQTSTDHSRVVVWNLVTGARVASVDYLPQLSWVGVCRNLPVFIFSAAGALYAADVYSGTLVAKLDLPAAASTCVLLKTNDINMLLDHCAQIRRVAPQDLGHCLSIAAVLRNESGDVRRRFHLLDMSQLIFSTYPVIEQYAHRFTNDQLAYVLSKIPDASDRHKASVVSSIVPPGVLVPSDNRKSTGSVATGLRAPSVATTVVTRPVETPASTVKSGTAAAKPASKKGSTATGTNLMSAKDAPIGFATSTPAASVLKIQRLVDQREASKTQREQRFKALWAAMQP